MDFLPTPFPFLLKGTHTAVKAKRDLDAANLRPAGLRKANAERYEIIFQSEFAICSWNQNVEETEISVCAQLGTCEKRTAAQCQMPIFFCRRNTFFFGSLHCAAVLFSQVPKLCTELDLSLLYILTLGTYSKFTRKNNFLALGVCFPQPCSCAGRRFATTRSRYNTTDESFRFHNNNFDEMRCKLDSIENPRSFEKYPNPTSKALVISCFLLPK